MLQPFVPEKHCLVRESLQEARREAALPVLTPGSPRLAANHWSPGIVLVILTAVLLHDLGQVLKL